MIAITQVGLQSSNGGISYSQLSSGWYYNPATGYFFVDADGNTFSGNPYTGLLFGPLALVYPQGTADTEIDARTLFSNAPIFLADGTYIKINFEFCWSGAAGTKTVTVGSCSKTMIRTFTIRDQVTVAIPVNASTAAVKYTGSGTFKYTAGGEMFIKSVDYDGYCTLYTWAFSEVVADFSQLKITSYAKV